MTAGPPPVVVALAWQGDRRFEARADGRVQVVDGERRAGLSPPESLAVSLAGCMGIDVVDVLRKGRLALDGLRVRLEGQRAAEYPRRFTRIALHFVVAGDVPPDRVERAIALSRDRYCTVWHSLRPDIALLTSYEVVPRFAPRRTERRRSVESPGRLAPPGPGASRPSGRRSPRRPRPPAPGRRTPPPADAAPARRPLGRPPDR